jgi:hypothetical protein
MSEAGAAAKRNYCLLSTGYVLTVNTRGRWHAFLHGAVALEIEEVDVGRGHAIGSAGAPPLLNSGPGSSHNFFYLPAQTIN